MTGKRPPSRSILITGASSGIGAALARAYAEPGVFLALGGRHRQRLQGVVEACRARGAEAAAETADVTNRTAMTRWIAAADDRRPLDLVIANAGISAGTAGRSEDEESVRTIFAVNLAGVLNTVLPVIPRMRARGRGQIAMMSSVAAFRGLPGTPAYSASKAAVKAYGEALRGRLAGDGIGVSVICPGFVDTPMTATNPYPMPLRMPPGRAACIIRRGLARNRARIAFPFPIHAAAWLLGTLPPAWTDPVLTRLTRKG